MRSTRNASKGTPPPVKKTGKGTPGKGTPKTPAAEKKDDTAKAEADPIVSPDVELVIPLESSSQADVQSEGADALNVSKEEKPDDAVVAEMIDAAKETEGSKSKPSATKKKGGTPKKKAEETSEKEAVPLESKPEIIEEVVLEKEPEKAIEEVALEKEPEKVVEEAALEKEPEKAIEEVVLEKGLEKANEVLKESAPDQVESASVEALPADVDKLKETVPEQCEPISVEASKAVEEEGTDKKVIQQAGDDEEMQEGDQNQVKDLGMDEAKDEEDDEEDDNGEEEDNEEDEVEGDLVDERPVTERQKRKKLEVFVGGLDKEATADEVKKTFEVVGEVLEVRLTTHPQSGKNRGYAFVRFATVDQATRAATELDGIKIRDKKCAVVPSEDNDTLFVGNLCKSWNSAQVLEKLKEYGVEGIGEMILFEDQEHEGHNKGHAFLEFVTHSDALKAFKRLSKPDAIFGCDRSARIAWAEGSSEPDEIIMAKVKSVFVDGMPAEWDDGKLKEHFGKHGDIERIVLAKNIPKSKRRDFAFVNFATRDAALAAIEALNDVELADGDKKVKLKVELAKPAPRKKRIRGHRGSYPVGGGPSKEKKGKGGGQNDRRRGEGGRSMSRGGRGGRGSSQKNSRGEKRKGAEERPLREERPREERPRDKHDRGSKLPRAGAAVPRGNRGARVDSSSRRGGSGAHSDEDYMPMGARMNPGTAASRDFSRRPPREAAYPRRTERDHAYSGRGSKRSYSVLDEEAAYYESVQRGYPRARVEYADPRARVEYADPALGGVSLYPNSLRAAPLGHGSLGHTLPAVRGSHGYTSALPGAADYGPAGAADPRGASYPSTYYGSRAGTGYSLPSGSGPYY